ncbi:MAG: hypothetical protein JJU06_10565 [Ectothiorhodospiraceae bacterium]|nr:hypothetical protein [Ectothiorhodospiraceae bacterium]MCH8503690.1 hypothetical protein [Ectothiorhodospiraceae bacterium]
MMTDSSDSQGFAGALATVLGGYLRALGPLRAALLLFTAVVIVLAPGGDTVPEYEGTGFFFTIVVPVMAPLFLSGLLLDALMSRVLMDGASGERQQQLRVVIRSELIAALVLVVVYLPYLISIFQ